MNQQGTQPEEVKMSVLVGVTNAKRADKPGLINSTHRYEFCGEGCSRDKGDVALAIAGDVGMKGIA